MPNVAQRMMEIFHALGMVHGRYELKRGTVRRTEAGKLVQEDDRFKYTHQGPATEELVTQHLAGVFILGLILAHGGLTYVGCLDFDWYPVDLVQLENAIEELRLPLVVCKSKSGGAHAYLFLSEPVSDALVRQKLEEWKALLIHLAPPGKIIEVFPKTGDRYLNMPYCGGEKAENYAIQNGRRLSLEEFISFAAERRRDRQQFEDFSPRHAARPDNVKDFTKERQKRQSSSSSSEKSDQPFYESPPCLETILPIGVGEGGRNNTLYHTAVYLRLRFPNEWASKLQEYNQDYMRPPLLAQELRTMIVNMKPNHRYLCSSEPMCSVCNEKECKTRRFGIDSTYDHRDLGEIFKALKCFRSDDPTDQPTYWLHAYGHWVQGLSYEDLENQRRLGLAIGKQLAIVHRSIKPKIRWDEHLQELMANHMETAIHVFTGKRDILQHLEEYCSKAGDQESVLLDGAPYTNGAAVYFTYRGFGDHLRKHQYTNREIKDLQNSFYIWCRQTFAEKFNDKEVKVINGKGVLCLSIPKFEQGDPSPPSSPPPEEAM